MKTLQAENRTLLGRRNQQCVSHSFEMSMRRPDSPCLEDYYARELLGDSSEASRFSDCVRSSVSDPSCVYSLFDMILSARNAKSTHLASTFAAMTTEVKSELAEVAFGTEEVTRDRVVAMVQSLSQQLRLVVRETKETEIAEVITWTWEAAVVAVEKALGIAKAEGEKAREDMEELLKLEEAKLAKAQATVVSDLSSRLAKAQDDIKRLNAAIDHLREEKSSLAEMLRDRDDEIASLKLPPNLKDFDKLLEEMSSYLEEAEGRQTSQASLLESISVMLDTTRLRSSKRRCRRLQDSPQTAAAAYPQPSALVTSPQQRPSVLVTSGPKPMTLKSPPKLQLGEKAFFHMMTSDRIGDEPPSAISLRVPEKLLSKDASGSSSEGSDEDSLVRFCEEQAQTVIVGELPSEFPSRELRPIPTNALLRELERVQKQQPPMAENTLLRFMEGVFEELFKMDILREARKQPYDQLQEFLLSYLYTMAGLRSQARKSLSALMNGLEKMAASGHLYGRLLCRLLGVFGCGFVAPDLLPFLTKAQAAFIRLNPSALKTCPELGGAISFIDASDLVAMLFRSKWESASRVLASCCPASLSDSEVVSVLLCGKLWKLGRDLKFFFLQVDTEKCGTIGKKAFAEGVRNVLEVAVAKEKVDKFWELFDTDRITFQQISALDVREFAQRADSKQCFVTRCHFLSAVLQEYDFLLEKDAARLSALFKCYDTNSDGVLTIDEFREMVQSLESNIDPATAVSLYRKVLEISDQEDAMSPESFAAVALEQKLGAFGQFGLNASLQNCEPMLRQVLGRTYEPSSPKGVFRRKGRKATCA